MEEGHFVTRLETKWGPLLGVEVTTYLFGREVLWVGNWKAFVWEERHEG